MTTEHGTTQPTGRTTGPGQACTPQYEVRVQGRLESRWAAWFDGLSLSAEEDGTTVIRGSLVDQAALHGLLQKLRDLGIPLVALSPLPTDGPIDGPTDGITDHPTTNTQPGATS